MVKSLRDLGERALIQRLEELLPDVGDDAAVLELGDQYLVLSTDMIYKPTHILDEMSWVQRGKYIVSINYSDIAAMGAKPLGFLLSYGSPDVGEEEFNDLIHGVKTQCERYDTRFLGGDTNEVGELTLAGFALGTTKKPVLRSGAKAGDLVAVTGSLGSASLGVDIIVKKLADQVDKKLLEEILKHTLEPEPRVAEGLLLNPYASALTDVSDSLAVSLHSISEKSKVGLEVDSGKIPYIDSAVKAASELRINMQEKALYGGGDYQLLFTIPEQGWRKVDKKIEATVIGRVVKGSGVRGTSGDEIPCRGYEHFRK